jgi:hypothetical protein
MSSCEPATVHGLRHSAKLRRGVRAMRRALELLRGGTQPGQIALQVMPVVAVSSARPLVKLTTPCLDATYADLSTEATNPCTDAMLMIRPRSRLA